MGVFAMAGKASADRQAAGKRGAIGQQAERTDPDKAAGQYMEQEAAQELLGGKGQHALVIALGVILPAKGDLVILEGD